MLNVKNTIHTFGEVTSFKMQEVVTPLYGGFTAQRISCREFGLYIISLILVNHIIIQDTLQQEYYRSLNSP